MPRRFGVMLLQNRSMSELVEWAARYDAAGADALYVADHLANPFDVGDEWHDGWLTLAALAAATSHCRVGTLVTTFVLHSPTSVARKAATLQQLSGGRLVVGVGAGGAPLDRAMSGVGDAWPQLARRLDAGLATVRSLLDGAAVDVPDVPGIGGRTPPQTWTLDEPARHGRRPELMVGGQGDPTMRAAVRHADAWNGFAGHPADGETAFDVMARHLRRLDELCAEQGRAPVSLRRTVLLDFLPGLAPATADELAETAERLWAAGYDEVIAYSWFGRGSGPRSPEALLAFIEDRLPGLR